MEDIINTIIAEQALQAGSNWTECHAPQRPKGQWITQWNVAHQKEYYYCSECREEFSYDGETGIKMNDYDFCPSCGADMRGDENVG